MGELAKQMGRRGFKAQKWEAIGGAGTGLMFKQICKSIHANDMFIAEVTETNLNVIFELGYAVGVGRNPIILKDSNRVSTSAIPLLPTQYQCHYERLEQVVQELSRYASNREDDFGPNRTAELLSAVNLDSENEGAVYFVPAWQDQSWRSIERVLESAKRIGRITSHIASDPTDTLFDSFLSHAHLVAESEYVVGFMVQDSYRDALVRNAPVALVLGLAAGLGKEVLLLHEQPARPLLDLGTVLHRFTGPSQAASIVDEWLLNRTKQDESVAPLTEASSVVERAKVGEEPMEDFKPEDRRSRRRAQRARVRFFGPPDATLDTDLMQYFLDTPSFEQALEGEKELLIGRKGVGKSSIMTALESEFSSRRDRLFVKITPIELEYEQLSVALEQIGPIVHPNFLYPSFWRFIILTEIVRALRDHSVWLELPGVDARDRSIIRGVSNDLDAPITSEFSARIMFTLREIGKTASSSSPERVQSEVENIVSKARLYPLEDALARLSNALPIFVAIDDIDKRWNPDFVPSVIWLRGLFDEMARLRRKLKRGLTSVVMLREDMFSYVKLQDPDFANRSTSLLRWTSDQLEEVIRARLEFLVDQEFSTATDAWDSIFPTQVKGVKTSHYMIRRTLMRPRDLIQYCQLAVERARAAGRNEISEADVLEAEGEFSSYLYDSIRTEALLTHPRLDLAMTPFLGADEAAFEYSEQLSQGLKDLKEANVVWATSERDIVVALYELGFLGLGVRDGDTCYYSWMRSYEDANRLTRERQELRIHPGFHSHLEVRSLEG
jgi:hypothetical protein